LPWRRKFLKFCMAAMFSCCCVQANYQSVWNKMVAGYTRLKELIRKTSACYPLDERQAAVLRKNSRRGLKWVGVRLVEKKRRAWGGASLLPEKSWCVIVAPAAGTGQPNDGSSSVHHTSPNKLDHPLSLRELMRRWVCCRCECPPTRCTGGQMRKNISPQSLALSFGPVPPRGCCKTASYVS
jgi:hypothetical protein